jgi:hypothetical protein
MLERDIQKKSVALARKQGWWCCKFVAQGRRSAPDYIFAKNGFVWFCEFKREGEEPTELQADFHQTMREYALRVCVCDSVEKFLKTLLYYEGICRK